MRYVLQCFFSARLCASLCVTLRFHAFSLTAMLRHVIRQVPQFFLCETLRWTLRNSAVQNNLTAMVRQVMRQVTQCSFLCETLRIPLRYSAVPHSSLPTFFPSHLWNLLSFSPSSLFTKPCAFTLRNSADNIINHKGHKEHRENNQWLVSKCILHPLPL